MKKNDEKDKILFPMQEKIGGRKSEMERCKNRKPRKTLSFNEYELDRLQHAILQTYGTDNYLFDKIDGAVQYLIDKRKERKVGECSH